MPLGTMAFGELAIGADVVVPHLGSAGGRSAQLDVDVALLLLTYVSITAAPTRDARFVLLNGDGSERESWTVLAGQTWSQLFTEPVTKRTDGGGSGEKTFYQFLYRLEN